MFMLFSLFFFFQAEDGIRDGHVTGVQTCALPIFGVEQHIPPTHVVVLEARLGVKARHGRSAGSGHGAVPGMGPRSTASSRHHSTSHLDRKSTRLNSSHVATSYAVFCMKKKSKI